MLRVNAMSLSIVLVLLSVVPETGFAVRAGRPAGPDEYPAVGFLDPNCTATLINENTVITAGHCVFPNNLTFNSFTLRAGNGVEQTVQPVAVRIYANSYTAELTLIRLKAKIRGVAFPKLSSDLNLTPQQATIVGYGEDGRVVRNASKLTGVVYLEGMSNVDIQDGAGGNPMLQVKPLTDKSNIACQGDSGGPLLSGRGELLGIISFGFGPRADFSMLAPREGCNATQVTFYVPIAPYLPWIKNTLKEFDQKY